ncbi:MAG: CoA-acylating methylmalonate-semialdehyde dehydrogenase [Myxococcales bacterium]|nr:CoA-acylating methylmalonate-semialdehyde dehydrogenase [Myxococcales bacterium]MCB9643618.1 CoA-acylating methylmalonate-semialdehyde dehydrogenase [Myxococcales bacterium]
MTSYDFQTVENVKNWIGGQWVDAASGAQLEVLNPRHGKVMTHVALSAKEDVEAAVQAAKAAFPAWKATPMKERAQILYRAKAIMERDLKELAWLISHENGKTYEESIASVAKGIECTEFGCSVPNIPTGGISFVSRGVTCETHHEALGVCAGVVPFNFPFMVPLWMLPQALVAGNTFVLKPSEQVPIGVSRLATIFKEAGLPDGVFNVVNGTKEVVESLCDHPEIKAMAFVGSTRVAKLVYTRGAQTGRRMLCLGGAKNHLIVVPDAEVEMASTDIVRSFTGCAGQRCMAASAMVAVGKVDHIINAVVEKARNLKLGYDMGAIITEASLKRITGYIELAEKAGAKVLLDGRGATVKDAETGYWLAPTILEVTPDMPAYTDEIFGPVLSIVRVKTLDEALALENAHEYGNGGSIYTSSGSTARYAASRINAGMIGINIGVPVPREPYTFGGWEHSKFGHGDITGIDGYYFWTRPRKITTKWALQPDATWMS